MLTKKNLMKGIIIGLALLIGAGVIIMAVMSSFKVVAAETKLPIYSVSRTDNKVSLTFDCAWGNSNTDIILETLKMSGAKATFFVTGEFCDKYPEDVKKIYDAGHEIGNHSDAHPHVKDMNINDLIADTRECSRKIKMITGEEPTLYRAPYGEHSDKTVATIEGMKLKMIQWSVDSLDWQEPDSDTIINKVSENTVSGSILLFHNDLKNTEKALPDLLSKLKKNGFSFVKVSDLIYPDSYHIDSNGMQIYDMASLLPAAKYSDNAMLNETMEIFRQNMTLDQLYMLREGATTDLLSVTAPLLDNAHLTAVESASYEELKEAVNNLIAYAEQNGAGGLVNVSNDPNGLAQQPRPQDDPDQEQNPSQGQEQLPSQGQDQLPSQGQDQPPSFGQPYQTPSQEQDQSSYGHLQTPSQGQSPSLGQPIQGQNPSLGQSTQGQNQPYIPPSTDPNDYIKGMPSAAAAAASQTTTTAAPPVTTAAATAAPPATIPEETAPPVTTAAETIAPRAAETEVIK